MLPRRATAVLLAAPLLLLTGCGDVTRLQPSAKATASPLAKPTPTINPAPTTPPATTAAPAPTSAAPTATGSAPPAVGGGTEVKGTIDNKFVPAKLEIKAGDEVTWTLDGAHSVTGGTGPQADPNSPMQSEIGVPTYKVKFDKAGTYPYFCQPHISLGMVGEIVVK